MSKCVVQCCVCTKHLSCKAFHELCNSSVTFVSEQRLQGTELQRWIRELVR